jgi:tryptophan synthase beta chain
MKYAKDSEVLEAVKMLMQTEWILPALESAHAVVEAVKLAPTLDKNKIIVIWISWRWDKDLFITAPKLDKKFVPFLKDYIKKHD